MREGETAQQTLSRIAADLSCMIGEAMQLDEPLLAYLLDMARERGAEPAERKVRGGGRGACRSVDRHRFREKPGDDSHELRPEIVGQRGDHLLHAVTAGRMKKLARL